MVRYPAWPTQSATRSANSGSSSTISTVSATAGDLGSSSRVGGRVGQRQRDPDACPRPAVCAIADRQLAPVCLDQPSADVEPEPCPRDARLADVPRPVERFHHQRAITIRDADPLVLDTDCEPTIVDPCVEDDRATVGRVLERIADEVLEDLTDPDDVDVDRGQVIRREDHKTFGLP